MTHVLNEPQAEGRGDPLPGVDPAVDPHGLLAWPVVQRQLRRGSRSRVLEDTKNKKPIPQNQVGWCKKKTNNFKCEHTLRT